jgi:hypothetical protein
MVTCSRASQTCSVYTKIYIGHKLSVHPEMVDFGFRQGPSEFSTAGIARYVED